MPGALPGDGLPTIETTDIELSDQAREYVAARGGTLFLRVRHNRCCSGGLIFLDASASAHGDSDRYERVSEASPEVRLFPATVVSSHTSVEVRGKVRPHLVAYWDGCAYRI